MERIFRSLLQVGNQPDAEEALSNWYKFQEFHLEFNNDEDRKISDYLTKFYNQLGAPPDFSIIKDYFEKSDDIETVARLDEIKNAQFYIRTNYVAILKSEQEQQQTKNFIILCRDAAVIAEHGKNLDYSKNGKKILRGVNDAVNFVFDNLGDFTRVESGEKLEGVVSDDAEEVIEDYNLLEKTNKFANRNLFGLEPVDSACKGHRTGEYWIHAAFTSHLKTALSVNYAYNNTMLYGKNIFYVILEMPYKQLLRQFYALHSSHGKFVTEWYKDDGYRGLNYAQLRDGEFSPKNKERLLIVARDFKQSAKGKLYVWRPPHDVTINDIKRKAELFHNKYGCDGIIIDHLGLVVPNRRSSDYVVSLNSIVRDGRMLALNFARGKSVPVLGLFQMNRQGLMRAEKNDGRYDFAALSYANEIEKSADVITYTFLNDDLRSRGQFMLGNLKNRDNAVFERMFGKIIWETRRMRAIETNNIEFDEKQMIDASKQIASGFQDLVLS